MYFRKLIHYFIQAIKNPKKTAVWIRDYYQKAYIFLNRNDRPTILIESKSSSVINLQALHRVPLISIFSRVKLAHAFFQSANKFRLEENKFVLQKGVAIYLKQVNAQVKQLMFADLHPFRGRKFILIDVYTLPKIEKIASVNYHFLVCLITSEEQKSELFKYPKFSKFINTIITVGCDFEKEHIIVPLLIKKDTTYEVIAALDFIISAQVNYEEALIPLKIPATYDPRMNNGTFNGLDAFFDLQNTDVSKSDSFQTFLAKNLKCENVNQVYVNENIELTYLTMINHCKEFGNWAPLAQRLLGDGYHIEITR